MYRLNFANISWNLHKIYKLYLKEVPKEIQTTKENFLKINELFVRKAVDRILKAEEVKFPIIGSFRIKKVLMNYHRLYVDHKRTKELGIKVYHLNENREGYFYKWFWNKNSTNKFIHYYSFCAARYSVRRRLPKILKTTNQEFFL
jgi:hypothetical protein